MEIEGCSLVGSLFAVRGEAGQRGECEDGRRVKFGINLSRLRPDFLQFEGNCKNMGVLQGEFSRIFPMGVQVVFGGDYFRDFRSVAGSVRIPVNNPGMLLRSLCLFIHQRYLVRTQQLLCIRVVDGRGYRDGAVTVDGACHGVGRGLEGDGIILEREGAGTLEA